MSMFATVEDTIMDDKTRTELEAAVYRRLVDHLRTRADVQNIDLMNLAGFCRNCLSNWMKEAADAGHIPMTKDEGRRALTPPPCVPTTGCGRPEACRPGAERMTAARIAKDHLKAFVERIERLEEEKKTISDDIRDVYAEAKANGFDVKALRSIVRLRKQDVEERKEHEAILATYMLALGMIE